MFKFSRLFILLTLVAAIITLPRWILNMHYAERINDPEDAPTGPVAIVFGAGLRRDGRPTTVLADRVQTAVLLFQQNKVDRLLLSGSTRGDAYDETKAMFDYAISLGMKEENILLDPHGDRTFLTCRNAVEALGIDQAILVSQRYHLPRALVLCESLGLKAQGVASDLHTYRAQSFWNTRESFATLRALWDAGKYKLDSVIKPPTQPLT